MANCIVQYSIFVASFNVNHSLTILPVYLASEYNVFIVLSMPSLLRLLFSVV